MVSTNIRNGKLDGGKSTRKNDARVLLAIRHDEGEFTRMIEGVLENFVQCDAFDANRTNTLGVPLAMANFRRRSGFCEAWYVLRVCKDAQGGASKQEAGRVGCLSVGGDGKCLDNVRRRNSKQNLRLEHFNET